MVALLANTLYQGVQKLRKKSPELMITLYNLAQNK